MAHFSSLLNAFFLVLAISTYSTTCNSLIYEAITAPKYENMLPLSEVLDRQANFQKIPSSCYDLATIGRRENGLHLIKAVNGIKVVFCDFLKIANTAGYETEIGYTDVKTGPVFFYGQRNTDYLADIVANNTITYEVEISNIGGGFDKNTGIFTVPKTGRYFFLFSALVKKGGSSTTAIVNLRKNSEIVASTACSLTSSDIPLNLQQTLILNAGDTVSMTALCSKCKLNGGVYTSFSGRLLEENV